MLPACIPIDKIQDRRTFIPQWYEWMLLSKFPPVYCQLSVCLSLGVRPAAHGAHHGGGEDWRRPPQVRAGQQLRDCHVTHFTLQTDHSIFRSGGGRPPPGAVPDPC